MNDLYELYDLMMEQLRDLYDGELQQFDALTHFDDLATSFELREIIEHHQQETKRQIDRLRVIFNLLSEKPEGEYCEAMNGLINEAKKLAYRSRNDEVRDAGLITSIQHINHYEIAGYGSAIAYAKALNLHEIAGLLIEILNEEKQSDRELSELAEDHINIDARWASPLAGQS